MRRDEEGRFLVTWEEEHARKRLQERYNVRLTNDFKDELVTTIREAKKILSSKQKMRRGGRNRVGNGRPPMAFLKFTDSRKDEMLETWVVLVQSFSRQFNVVINPKMWRIVTFLPVIMEPAPHRSSRAYFENA